MYGCTDEEKIMWPKDHGRDTDHVWHIVWHSISGGGVGEPRYDDGAPKGFRGRSSVEDGVTVTFMKGETSSCHNPFRPCACVVSFISPAI